jgi:16S rRNA (cytosine967-C5)-methyltransferase
MMPPNGREDEPLKGIEADLVVIDAPCTGTGTWRRNPDAKLRVRPGALEERVMDQEKVLDRAARLLKPKGRIAYMTCSLLREENDAQIESFLQNYGFTVVDLNPTFPHHKTEFGVQLTPLKTGTDGFYIAMLEKM